jgi:uncharacterized membrane protein
MKPQNRTKIGIGLTALTAAVGLFLISQLPEQVAIRFGSEGQPNGYTSKTVALALMPAVQISVLGLFSLIPRIDPLGENIQGFRRSYDSFVIILVGFLGYIHVLTLLWNTGYDIGIVQSLIPGSAVLYYAIGVVMESAEQNWFVGIRTPWTLSNEDVWDDTHKLGGKLMKVAAVITLGGLVFTDLAIFFLAVPVTAVAVLATGYSYWDYRRKTRGNKGR